MLVSIILKHEYWIIYGSHKLASGRLFIETKSIGKISLPTHPNEYNIGPWRKAA